LLSRLPSSGFKPHWTLIAPLLMQIDTFVAILRPPLVITITAIFGNVIIIAVSSLKDQFLLPITHSQAPTLALGVPLASGRQFGFAFVLETSKCPLEALDFARCPAAATILARRSATVPTSFALRRN
jgi:hypothetical protein